MAGDRFGFGGALSHSSSVTFMFVCVNERNERVEIGDGVSLGTRRRAGVGFCGLWRTAASSAFMFTSP
jgi:hypothetical protein